MDKLLRVTADAKKRAKTTANANAPATAIVATTADAKKTAKTTANANAPATAMINAMAMIIAIIMAIVATTATANAQFHVTTLQRIAMAGSTTAPASNDVMPGGTIAWRITFNAFPGSLASQPEPTDFIVFRLAQAECAAPTALGDVAIDGSTTNAITVASVTPASGNPVSYDITATLPATALSSVTGGYASGDCFRLGFSSDTETSSSLYRHNGIRRGNDGTGANLDIGVDPPAATARHIRPAPTLSGSGLFGPVPVAADFDVTDQFYNFTPPPPAVPAPTVSSVVRSSSASADTTGGDVIWTVTFSDDVMGVDDGDFEAFNHSGATMLEIATTVTMTSASVYEVTAALPTSGYDTAHTVGLRLARASADHMIQATGSGNTDYAADNDDPLLSANYGSATNQTYTLTTPAGPTFSLVGLETTTTDDDTARFRLAVPGNIDLMDLVIADFVCNDSGGTTLTPTLDTMTRTATNIEILCTHGVAIGSTAMITAGLATTLSTTPTNFVLADVAFPGGTGTSGTTRMYAITPADRTPPRVMSITAGTPDQAARTVEWTIVFTETVANVTASSFTIGGMGSTSFGTFTPTSPTTMNGMMFSATWTVTTTTQPANNMPMVMITENATSSAIDSATPANRHVAGMNPISSSPVTFNDTTAPTLQSVSRSESFHIGVDTSATPAPTGLSWTVTFSEAVTGVLPAHFELTQVTGTFIPEVMALNPGIVSAEPTTSGATSSATWIVTMTALPNSDTLGMNAQGMSIDQSDSVILGISFASGATAIMDTATTTANAFVVPANPLITISGNSQITYNTSGAPVEQTVELINTVIESTARSYLVSTPRISTRLNRSGSLSGDRSDSRRNNFVMSSTSSTMDIKYSGVFSMDNFLDTIAGAVLGSPGSSRSSSKRVDRDFSIFPSDMEFWVQTTYSSIEDEDAGSESESLFIHSGVDYELSRRSVFGVMFQYDSREDQMDNTNQFLSGKLDSTGWFVGPYVVSRFGSKGGLLFEGRASYGGSTNDFDNSITDPDTFDTERVYVSASIGSGDGIDFGSWLLSPRVEYSYYNESYDSYMNSSSQVIPEGDFTLNRLTLGPSFSRTYGLDSGSLLTPSLGFSALYDTVDSTSSPSPINDLTGKVDLGVDFSGTRGLNWNLGGYYDGIGSNIDSYGVTGGIRLDF